MSMNEMNTTIQKLEVKVKKYEEYMNKYEGFESKMEEMTNKNRVLNENVSDLRNRCTDSEVKVELTAKMHDQALQKDSSNQEIINI